MRLNLAKISPILFESVMADPDLLDHLFEPNGSTPTGLAGFDEHTDTSGHAFSALCQAAAAYAHMDFWHQDTWLTRATGAGSELLGYACPYGSAWYLSPRRVSQIAEGLASEVGPARAAGDPGYAEIVRSFAVFYAEAAREGKVVVGGMN